MLCLQYLVLPKHWLSVDTGQRQPHKWEIFKRANQPSCPLVFFLIILI